MNYRRILSLLTALAAAFALALPAGAQSESPFQPGDRQPGNPVAHCLPDQAGDGDDAGEADQDESEDESEEGDEAETQTVAAAPRDDSNGDDARQDADDARQDVDDARPEDSGDARQDGDDARPENGDDARQDGDVAEDGSGNDQTEDGAEGDEDGDAGRDEVARCVLESLPDIVGNAHAASVVGVVSRGIAQGRPDGTFAPHEPVTRAQMATFLTRALDLKVPEDAEVPDDVDAGSPHADAVAAVVEAAIALGRADGSFGPEETVSRAQMASFLDRAFDLANEAGGELPDDAVGNVHADAIADVIANGVALGFADGSFRPDGDVTRGQMASFLIRALDR